MAMIEVEDLRKSYGSFRALLGVSFQVDRGEILGFLGPNGAGKTTTMKILTGFLNPSYGRAVVDGHDVLENSVEVRRKIGYLPESTPLYDDMAVFEYLRYCGALRRMGSARLKSRLAAVVEMTGLGPKYRALIKTLSKGYRQRVGIAQALLHEPEIIILDEPTVGLDPNQVVDVRGLIREVGANRTVILCSHILSEVEAVCGRVVIINEGRIVANGTVSELSRRHGGQPGFEAAAEGPLGALQGSLSAVAGFEGVSAQGEAEGVATVRFSSARPRAEVGAEVAQAVSAAGLRLVSLVPHRASLEDVFRTLTRKEGA